MKQEELSWGDRLKPTVECVNNGAATQKDEAIFIRYSTESRIVIIRKGRATIEYWTMNYWRKI